MEADFDIAVCGAGPIGLAFTAMLLQQGVAPARIALIDARTNEQSMRDPRSIALSWGSHQLLQQLNAWPSSATAIQQIHVSRRGHFGRTLIDASSYQLPALGHVLRYGDIITALEQRITAHDVTVMRPAKVVDIIESAELTTLMLADRPPVTARLTVQAEGGLFGEQDQKNRHRDYDQTAIVGHVMVDSPIAHRAFERFCNEGPLALLPQEDGYAMVWCVRPETAQRLQVMEDPAFLRALQEAFGERLGRFTSIGKRNAFALGLNAQPSSSKRVVSIGNAAQTLHPVAGQGLNLGLRDASVLARLLHGNDVEKAISDFSAARQDDRNMTIRLTDLMASVFAGSREGSMMQALLGLSLGCIDCITPAKKLLADQMMYGQRS